MANAENAERVERAKRTTLAELRKPLPATLLARVRVDRPRRSRLSFEILSAALPIKE
jgi:hypothetical protein